MKGRIIAVLLIMVCANLATGQVSGYLGKRTIVGVETRIFPNLWQSAFNDRPVALNLQAGFQAERILTRTLSAGVSWQYINTQSFYDTNGLSGNMSIRGHLVGIDLRAYSFQKNGNIPPLGVVHRFGLSYLTYWLSDDNRRYYPDGRKELGKYEAALLSYTLAAQRVFFDKYILTTGLGFSWTVALSPDSFPDQDIYLWERSMSRLRGFFGGQLVLGLGVLL